MMDRLADLRWHWGSAYEIANPVIGMWVARRLSTGRVLTADTAAGLRALIRADYR